MTPREELAVAYAESLWKWSEVEHAAFYIYLAAVGNARDDSSLLRTSYFALTMTEPRFAINSAIAARVWSGAVLDDFRKIQTALTDSKRTRGELAHLTGGDGRLTLSAPKSEDQLKAQKVRSANWTAEKLRAQTEQWSMLLQDVQRFARERFQEQTPRSQAEQASAGPLTLRSPNQPENPTAPNPRPPDKPP